ncbi:MAG TPA: diacylglycerol kinase [Candidatus Baltobacteraceae bacterium]|jgi:diacylglycerol kinase (ATP)|nr:diacylglycerol kinase [Candidatus Baltobacteraceae bacterium]
MSFNFLRSFNHAFEGIMYAARTQSNMRTHLMVSLLVLLASLWLRLDRYYVVALIVMIALVLSLELLNTAVEAIVDLLTVVHHPLAKTAKDAAAGAVLVASIAAVVVGYLVFYQGIINGGQRVFEAVAAVPSSVAFVILAAVAILTIFAKARAGRGSALQGGAISGHAALAFAAATMIAFFYQRPLAATLAYFIAMLVAQSRVEAKIHSVREVVLGGGLGTLAALAVYLLVRPHVVL